MHLHMKTAQLTRLVRKVITIAVCVWLMAYVLASALTGLYLMGALQTFDPRITPAGYGVREYTDVRIPSRDRPLTLAGWYLPSPGGVTAQSQAVVLVHGKDASRTQEMQGHFVEFAAALHRHGFAIVMVELRGHGQSDYGPLTFGVRERLDVLGAVDWLRAQGFAAGRIGVLGVSMGAASSLGAFADDEAGLIGAVVADCSFADFDAMVRFQWSRVTGLPGSFASPGIALAQSVSGADFRMARPVDDVVRITAAQQTAAQQTAAHKPVLFIHGAQDVLVPVQESRTLHAAYPASEYWEVADAQHGASYRQQPKAYVERVAAFFAAHL